jgi:hypothetical protein
MKNLNLKISLNNVKILIQNECINQIECQSLKFNDLTILEELHLLKQPMFSFEMKQLHLLEQ